jgi:hypothetical protein
MRILNRLGQIVVLFLLGIAVADPAQVQGQQRKFLLSKFDNFGCRSKGRTQDCSGKVMQEILAGGKSSIPILISQLTDTALTEEPIEDYWGHTNSGDVAYIVLTDLFLDADWETFNMPGVPDWPTVMKGCDLGAEGCWRKYLRKHGRKSVQQAWLRAWNLWKDRVYWEPTARCFRISKK